MSKYQTVEVPFLKRGNQCVLTDKQLVEQRWLKEFVERFKNCFVRDENLMVLVYQPPEAT